MEKQKEKKFAINLEEIWKGAKSSMLTVTINQEGIMVKPYFMFILYCLSPLISFVQWSSSFRDGFFGISLKQLIKSKHPIRCIPLMPCCTRWSSFFSVHQYQLYLFSQHTFHKCFLLTCGQRTRPANLHNERALNEF